MQPGLRVLFADADHRGPLSSAQAAPRVQRARCASHPRRLCRPCAHLCSPSRHPPPCQRQIKLLAASSFGRPLAAAGLGRPWPSGKYVPAGRPHRPLLHTGVHRRSARLHECAPGRPCVLVEGEAERRARRPRLQPPPQLGGHPREAPRVREERCGRWPLSRASAPHLLRATLPRTAL